MFKTLVGEMEATSGDARINGFSITSDMGEVQKGMGVTPQENILWPSITVEEHLYFFGRVKGLTGSALKEAVSVTLDSVDLAFARKRQAQKCSGGMMRRLAVAISLIGDSPFIVLDEPSTGLDILTREKLWTSVQNAKQSKAILLTTHSLEEADTLCDRVAILSRGKIMCIGNPEELKQRIGKGYHLNISVPESKVPDLHEAILGLNKLAEISTQLAGNLEYTLPKSVTLPTIFTFIESNRQSLQIRDWSINQSTLEDVFMAVTSSEVYSQKPHGEP